MVKSVIIAIPLFVLLFLSPAAGAGSTEDLERVAGAFSGFEVEFEDESLAAVHFSVGDRRVVADPSTEISGGDPAGPAVLLSLAQFVELAEHRRLGGTVEGTPGEEVLFAKRILIDPFDVPGKVVEVTGALTAFEAVLEDDDESEDRAELLAVRFLVAGEPAVAFDDTRIKILRSNLEPVMLRLEQFLALGRTHDLTGVVKGILDDGIIVARQIEIDPVDEPAEPVVLEGPFADFARVNLDPPQGATSLSELPLSGVSFSVEERRALATEDTEIVLLAPTLAMDRGEQLSLHEFLRLGLSAELAGRVEGRLEEGTVVARRVTVRRVDFPPEPIELEGRLRACEIGELETVLTVLLRRSDRQVDILVTPDTGLFFHDDDERPLGYEDLVRICDGGLVVELQAKGIPAPNESNDGVLIVARAVVFEYVDAAVRGRFQGGEVEPAQVRLAIGDVAVVVDEDTNIEFQGSEISLAALAELVESNETYFARAGGFLRKDGAIQARRLTVEPIEPPLVDLAGVLLSCEQIDDETVAATVQRGDGTTVAQVNTATRLAEKSRDELIAISLEAFFERCNARQVYRLFGVGPDGEPLTLSKAIISLLRVRLRGVFEGGEISDDEILIQLAEQAVRIDGQTRIFGADREPLSFQALAELVEAGEPQHAFVRGIRLKDESVQATLLRLRERPNIKVDTPIDGARWIRGRGTPGIAVDVFDASGDRLASGAVGITGGLALPTTRPLVLGESITPYAMGLQEQAPAVNTDQVFVSGFE